MINKLLAGTAMAVVPAVAMAADLPVRGPAPAPVFVQAAPTWGGFYVGANFGLAWTSAKNFQDNVSLCGNSLCGWESDDQNGSGVGGLAGLTAGYNFQSGNFVYGLEADIAGVWGGKVKNSNYNQELSTRAVATIRARLGIASGATLFYLTGGVAAVNQKLASDVGCSDCNYSGSSTEWNWAGVVGAGIEHQLGGGWSAKVEALYIPNVETNRSVRPFGVSKGFRAESDIGIVRFGVNYRFGAAAAAPVVARY